MRLTGVCGRRFRGQRLPGRQLLGQRLRARALAALLVLSALGVGACGGNTLQNKPVAPSILEPLVAQEQFPVYWLGSAFRGLRITRVARDPSGSYQIQYGNCTAGGENACVAPLQIVTSPDNSFLPGGDQPQRQVPIRGVRGISTSGGETLVVATGGVVVDLYADSSALARDAAAAMVTIGTPGAPGALLPRPLPNTGFAAQPLLSQQPTTAPMGWTSVLRRH
jgi:hypothetical protein